MDYIGTLHVPKPGEPDKFFPGIQFKFDDVPAKSQARRTMDDIEVRDGGEVCMYVCMYVFVFVCMFVYECICVCESVVSMYDMYVCVCMCKCDMYV